MRTLKITFFITFICHIVGLFSANVVDLRVSEQGKWQIYRNGEPFYVMGAGGDGSKSLLASCGANTIRTWGVSDSLQVILDQAHSLGLAVIVGHWLGHERHGFDYADSLALSEQKARIMRDVMKYKDHPALLIWALGNEMEGIGDADNPNIWSHIQDLAVMLKSIDPYHPVMTVTADIGAQRIPMINSLCPDVDIVGINTYGGLPSIPRRYREVGGIKPYLITEFGPNGVWETELNSWGAPPELTSTQKAEIYRTNFIQGCLQEPNLCLGALAFYWGAKTEATLTWFGMLTPDDNKLEAVDVMTLLWTGKPPADLCPKIISFEMDGNGIYNTGDSVTARMNAVDPEGATLNVTWSIYKESPDYLTFGETWWQALEIGNILHDETRSSATLVMPSGGNYRLYATVYDGNGSAATSNIPFNVIGPNALPKLKLPVAVYADGTPQPWAPSGWMGDIHALTIDTDCIELPHSGNTCMSVRMSASSSWAGMAWQDPPNDWGDLEGGYDLRGARRLSFWAKGRFGGETITVGVGLLRANTRFPDSDLVKIENLKLTNKWKKYSINLNRKDLSRIKTPFWWSSLGGTGSCVFYFDDIIFE